MAFAHRLKQQTVTNNDQIVAYQQATIGALESAYGDGLITREEYKQKYAYYSNIIREMGNNERVKHG